MKNLRVSKLDIPSGWNEITCNQLIELEQLELSREEYSDYDYVFEQIAILCDLDIDDDIFFELVDDDITLILNELKWMKNNLTKSANKYFELDGFTYKKINPNEMIAAEWITFDYYITNNYKLYVKEIIATAYRRISIDKYGNEIMEKFEFDFNQRVNSFGNITLDNFPVYELIDFRKKCFDNFDLANRLEDDEDDEDDDFKINDEEDNIENNEDGPDMSKDNYVTRANKRELEAKNNIAKVYNWEKIMMDLANNNILDAYKILDIPIVYIFRVITMRKNID